MKLLKYILSTVALVVLMTGCSSDEPEMSGGAAETCELVVTLNAGNTIPQKAPITNNPWEDGYPEDAGTDWENTVSTISLYFIPEGEDGASAISMKPTAAAGSDGKYEYRVSISVNA
ncbi:MAG: hypothetical protein NC548_61765, partial [Lachnospiraceae bacterium]|nr:hypothetical protein [Lachnospiraceae bacterium]